MESSLSKQLSFFPSTALLDLPIMGKIGIAMNFSRKRRRLWFCEKICSKKVNQLHNRIVFRKRKENLYLNKIQNFNRNETDIFKSYLATIVVGSFLWKKVIKVVKIPKRKDCQMSYTWEHFYCISNRYSNIWSQFSTILHQSAVPVLFWSSTVHCSSN